MLLAAASQPGMRVGVPEAVRMAAFHSRDHDPFMVHWAKLRGDHSNIIRTIVYDGQVAGNIGSWVADGRRLVSYWLGRECGVEETMLFLWF